jgi:hypothetical protein
MVLAFRGRGARATGWMGLDNGRNILYIQFVLK